MTLNSLITKYNVAAPRYTSYPTVPFWENELFHEVEWIERVQQNFFQSENAGISIYVHLPYCESLCTYCGCNTRITKNHTVEEPYIDALLKEWNMYRTKLGGQSLKITEIHLGGGTPTFFTAANLARLINGLLSGNEKTVNATFSFEAHPANTTEQHLQTLYNAGFKRLSLGIQDFDEKVQFVINRHQTVEDVVRVVELARNIGYESINFDLIYGLPIQTRNTIARTIEKSLLMSPERISFYSYAHVPWIKPGQRRFTEHDLPVGEEKLALYKLGKELILAAGYKDVGMDHFATTKDPLYLSSAKGELHRNFMGYTDRYTPLLIGLGVSSISDAWTAFAQNVKTVEEYLSKINKNELPVAKGHLLSADDLVLRQYILDIMCKGSVELKTGFYLNTKIKKRLESMVKDGLVAMDFPRVVVTDQGKSFLRNICMAFDERLQNASEDKKLFSQAI